MEENDGLKSKLKVPIILTIGLLIIGSILYFALGVEEAESSIQKSNKTAMGGSFQKSIDAVNVENFDSSIYDGMRIKTVYNDAGQVKLFVLAKNNKMAKMKTVVGQPIPESGQMVIGYYEAQIMMDEDLFEGVGDRIDNLFGLNIAVGGILNTTGSLLDDMHFLSDKDYDALDGEEGRVFVKLNDEDVPKLFMTYDYGIFLPLNFTLKEGKLEDFQTHVLVGEPYYPLIIGSREAEMMRKEKLFSKPGDIIKGFFGKNVVVVGIIEETGTALDKMHLLALTADKLD